MSADSNANNEKFKQKKILLKIIVVWDVGVGKTSICRKYVFSQFEPCIKSTVGYDFVNNYKYGIIEDKKQNSLLTCSFWRGCDGCIIVYDKTNKYSFHSIEM